MTKTAEPKHFEAEVQDLLNLMIHSLYTESDIFLRELISNASDALDKRRIGALTDEAIAFGDEEPHIHLEVDAERRTLTVADNGIGMTMDEMGENLGTIARSGTRAFLSSLKEQAGAGDTAARLIGQFGVGFLLQFHGRR